jgi:hypothetical protein
MKARILIILCCLFPGNIVEAHPVHISVVNIDVIADSGRIDFSVRLFYEDFQTFINYRYNTMIDFSRQNRMTTKEQQAIIDYISGNFYLTDNDLNILKTDFTGWKIEDESVWLFFCADLDNNVNELHIQNTILVELFSDQVNYLIYRKNEEETGVEFNKRKTRHSFNL